jgi:hypothetical protein
VTLKKFLKFWPIKLREIKGRTACNTGSDFYQNEHPGLSLSIRLFSIMIQHNILIQLGQQGLQLIYQESLF